MPPPSLTPVARSKVVNDESVTGVELHARVTCVAQLLQCRFVSPNDRILITMQPSIDFYATAIAALAIGWSSPRLHTLSP